MNGDKEPTPINAGVIFGVIRSFLGDFDIKVDRPTRTVRIQAKGTAYCYTYEQLVDELEKMINGTD